MIEEMQISKPVPTNASRAAVSSFAEQLAEKLSFRPGDSIQEIVSRLGGTIEYRNAISYGSEKPDSIVIRDYGDFTIFLGTMTSQERDRFTIAHELGHLFLHYPLALEASPGLSMRATRWVDESDSAQRRAEWEANWFAAAFLMPEKAFAEACMTNPDLIHLASLFEVSVSAIAVRKRTLGIA